MSESAPCIRCAFFDRLEVAVALSFVEREVARAKMELALADPCAFRDPDLSLQIWTTFRRRLRQALTESPLPFNYDELQEGEAE